MTAPTGAPRRPDADKPAWWQHLDTFYTTSSRGVKRLNPELLLKFAPELAWAAVDGKLKTNALRNLYDAFKTLQERVNQQATNEAKELEFDRCLPQLLLLRARAAHALGRRVIPKLFMEFLDRGVDLCTGPQQLNDFLLLFEAVAGWHSCYSKE
jgi:CRISPR type III-A-associated protein Csm2